MVIAVAALLMIGWPLAAGAEEGPLAVYPPMAPCEGEVFSFWFDGDAYVAGYQACDIMGVVDLGTYQATCPDGLAFSPASGGCIFASEDEPPVGGTGDPESGGVDIVYYDFYYIAYTDGDGANCHSEPIAIEENVVMALPEGTPVAVDLYQAEWARLAFESGAQCFVLSQFLSTEMPVLSDPITSDGTVDEELPTEIDTAVSHFPETEGGAIVNGEAVYQLPETGTGPVAAIPAQHQIAGIVFAIAITFSLVGAGIRFLGRRTAFGMDRTSDYQ
jgi:hypothetical protein